eukprot:g4135.t1
MRLRSASSVPLLLVREIYFRISFTAAVCQFELLGRPRFAFASLQLGRAVTWPTSRWPPLAILFPDPGLKATVQHLQHPCQHLRRRPRCPFASATACGTSSLAACRLDQFSPRARQRLRESLSTESSASSASYDNVFGGGRGEAVVGVEVPPPVEAGGGPQSDRIGCREPPNHFLCPITLQPMREPIHAEGELHSYERSALREHLRRNGRWEVQNRDVVFSGKSPIPGKHGKIVYSPWHAWDDGDWTMTRRKLGRPITNCYAFLTKSFAAPNVLRPNWKLKQEIDDWWEKC